MQPDISHEIRCLTAEISGLGKALGGLGCDLRNEANKLVLERIAQMEKCIMTTIKEFSDRVEAVFTGIGESVDSIVASQAGVERDVDALKAEILALQSTGGAVTPEDQALLNGIEAKANALAGKTKAISDALAVLDAATAEAPTA